MHKIKKWFESGSGLSEFSARMRHLFTVNILWVLCSLPVVTWGAASAAAFDALAFTDRAEQVRSARLYFDALRRRFRRGTAVGLLLLGIGGALGVCAVLLVRSGSRNAALTALMAFAALLYALTLAYAFPVCVRSTGSAPEVLVFALLAGLRQLPRAVLMAVLMAVPVVMAVWTPEWFLYTGLLWLIYGFACIADLTGRLACGGLRKLEPGTDFLLPQAEEIPVQALSGMRIH